MVDTVVPKEQSFGDLFGAAARENWIMQQKQQTEDLMTKKNSMTKKVLTRKKTKII